MTLEEMVIADNKALKKAGDDLAIAAQRVLAEYDGVHRLRLAIANWNKAIADEGSRGDRHSEE